MSYALSPYLVDIDKARAAVASGDDKLRRMIGGRFKQQMAHADAWFADELGQGAPSRYEALRAVVAGGPFDAAHAFQYGYAYQMICEFHGRWLFNNDFSPFRSGWLERVDEGLREVGVTVVAVTDFMYGSVPAPCRAPTCSRPTASGPPSSAPRASPSGRPPHPGSARASTPRCWPRWSPAWTGCARPAPAKATASWPSATDPGSGGRGTPPRPLTRASPPSP
ncbi:hypothetical protein [Streptomyces sp. CC210A]|uniref:DUF7691 family protein n=1 Tax=Streptomyces sp. CC210A TaxID=2898184 RepID=UPI001F411869|nr:hypothetical protein [Streptomyces sp. CC210A]